MHLNACISGSFWQRAAQVALGSDATGTVTFCVFMHAVPMITTAITPRIHDIPDIPDILGI
jgi:hypothetical protein